MKENSMQSLLQRFRAASVSLRGCQLVPQCLVSPWLNGILYDLSETYHDFCGSEL